jgi:hypothetical protein
MTTRDDVTAALGRAAMNRDETMARRVDPEITNRSTLFFAFALAFDDRAALAAEVERLREENAVLHRQQVRLLGLVDTHGPAGTTDEEA